LLLEEHNVTVVDITGDAFRRLGPKFRGQKVVGTGMDRDVLRRAGIEEADAFIAVTQGDNTNIMAAQIVKNVFKVPHVMARIYDPIRATAYRELGITTLCTTTLACGILGGSLAGESRATEALKFAEHLDQKYLEQIT
jgi:trk system potassium uptake protein TrkA